MIHAESGGARITIKVPDGSTGFVGVLGATAGPAAPNTWGDVDDCSDIVGDCL